jgi:hypothetical protein
MTTLCLSCRNHFREIVDEFFDGDPFAPLKYAMAEHTETPADKRNPTKVKV